eukprot:1154135-Pelagomonas_calceolata.AAC.1
MYLEEDESVISAMKTNLTEKQSLEKICLRLTGYHQSNQKKDNSFQPTFHQRMQDSEAQQSKPNFLLPTADSALSKKGKKRKDYASQDQLRARKGPLTSKLARASPSPGPF